MPDPPGPTPGSAPLVLGVIPARGGSKGIPRKNLAPVHGRPLLAYTADAALGSRRLTRVILSSDDEDILAAGRSCGLEAPFVRPAELSTDRATSAAVAQHGLLWVEADEHRRYDIVVLLEPTSPLRLPQDIDAAIDRLWDSSADAVVTVCRVEAPHPIKMLSIEGGLLRPFLSALWREGLTRQELPAVYALNGAVYAARAEVVRTRGSLWGDRTLPLEMPPERSVNVDSRLDVAMVEFLLSAPDRAQLQ